MKRLLLACSLAIGLAACGNDEAVVTYKLTFRTQDAAMRQELLSQALKVMEGRLQHIQGNNVFTILPTAAEGETYVTINVAAQEVADRLTEELARPIKIRIMALAAEGETPVLTLEGTQEGYIETGVTEAHVKQILADQDPNSARGRVQIQFTDEGHDKLTEVAKNFKDRKLGIFVREQPMRFFKFIDYKGDDIIVDNAPSYDIARIFASDVNVSLYVTFAPVDLPL